VQVGDLVKFVDNSRNRHRVVLILAVDVDFVKTTFGWVNKEQLEVVNASR